MRVSARSCGRPKAWPLAPRQAGWTHLQPAYLTIGDLEARDMMRALTDSEQPWLRKEIP